MPSELKSLGTGRRLAIDRDHLECIDGHGDPVVDIFVGGDEPQPKGRGGRQLAIGTDDQ